MPRSQVTVRVHRPAAVVFDAIVRHCWANDPAWEPEVLGVKPLDAGPLRVGTRVVMTRREGGRVLDTTYEVITLEPGRRIAVKHIDGPMRFELDWTVRPAGAAEADVDVAVNIGLPGAMRLLAPLLVILGPSRNARISGQMVTAIEAALPTGGGATLATA